MGIRAASRSATLGNLNNYAASMGTTTANCCNRIDLVTTGIFAYEAASSMQVITDGSSNTIAFGETLSGEPGPNFPAGIPGRLDREHWLVQACNLSDVELARG